MALVLSVGALGLLRINVRSDLISPLERSQLHVTGLLDVGLL